MRPKRVKYLQKRFRGKVFNCPNFSASGSVAGMRKQFYGDGAWLVRCGSYIYNITGLPDREYIYNTLAK
jgi:hypothetical protein